MTKTVADDIDDFFGTTKPTRGSRSGKAEDLPDGEYTFAVEAAEYKPDTSAGPIASLKLVVVSDGPHDGLKVEKSWFLSRLDNGNRVRDDKQVENLMLDLKTLGFDPENWTVANGRPFRKEFARAAKAMAQMMVLGKKKANVSASNGKTYHNLHLNKRSDQDGKPAEITKEYLDELEEATKDPFGGQ